MLLQLNVRNIALIEQLSIEFGAGMNCLSGETGAGKSIIIDSINIILGGRVSREIIRTGFDSASVEAVFATNMPLLTQLLQSMGIPLEEDNTLILFREFNLSGKNSCKINGRTATLSMLKRIGEVILDLHGQHDNQSLLRVESHIDLLDLFGAQEIINLKAIYSDFLSKFKEIRSKMKSITGDPCERERQADLFSYQIDEIIKANLKSDEDEELISRRTILMNSEKIAYALSKAYSCMISNEEEEGSCTADKLSEAKNEMLSIVKYSEQYSNIHEKIEELCFQIENIGDLLRSEREVIEYNRSEIEEIEERIDSISKLKRKYGNTIDKILLYCDSIQVQLDNLQKSEELAIELEEQAKEQVLKIYEVSAQMNVLRKNAANILETEICKQLEDLEMKKASFEVLVDHEDNSKDGIYESFGKSGMDKVEFLVSANPGEPVKALSKIASGGELSRMMLAIKTILADVDGIPTLVFDEIDIGISGQAARKVGEKMKLISKNHQVICVTHLAQIAAIAENNILISKIYKDDKTLTSAKTLDLEGKVQEISRLLDGNMNSEITAQHAREMINSFNSIE